MKALNRIYMKLEWLAIGTVFVLALLRLVDVV
jgi:hypothetical protein